MPNKNEFNTEKYIAKYIGKEQDVVLFESKTEKGVINALLKDVDTSMGMGIDVGVEIGIYELKKVIVLKTVNETKVTTILDLD
jgi:hypothetical protein